MQWAHLPSWHIAAFILKTGDDLRQEELAMQLLRICACAFEAAGCGVKMFVYDIVAVAAQAGAFIPARRCV
jgi:phosphatidylinositol kinase/protein kinase (PI-3  family)